MTRRPVGLLEHVVNEIQPAHGYQRQGSVEMGVLAGPGIRKYQVKPLLFSVPPSQ